MVREIRCVYCGLGHQTSDLVRGCAEKHTYNRMVTNISKSKPKASKKAARRVPSKTKKKVKSSSKRRRTKATSRGGPISQSNIELHKTIGSTQNYGDDT